MSDTKPDQSQDHGIQPAATEQIEAAADAQPGISVRPGTHYAEAAFKAGREDEYIDRMKSRYGGEW